MGPAWLLIPTQIDDSQAILTLIPHMSSHPSKLLASIEKFDGMNWEDWSYSVRRAFRLSHILRIAEGTETHPTQSATPTEAEINAIEIWDQRNEEGLGLIQLSIKASICQSIKEDETLAQNWKCLKDTYGTQTSLNLWVDIMKYFATIFPLNNPSPNRLTKCPISNCTSTKREWPYQTVFTRCWYCMPCPQPTKLCNKQS